MTVAVVHQHSPEGRAALLRAAVEATAATTGLQVLHVFSGSQDHRAQRAETEAVTVLVRDTLDASTGGPGVDWELLTRAPGPDTGSTFVDLVEASGADLLVLGSRRRSAVGKLLLGSTVQRILLDVPVPILLVKAPTGP